MPSRYDDELWATVPDQADPPPRHLVEFVRSLPEVVDALDIGCGDGRLAAELRAERITAADPSPVALERARRTLPKAEVVELTPDAPLPLPDTAFDLVLCAETIEHVRDVQLLLSEVRRVLRPGGTLAATTPAHGRPTAARAALLGWERVFDPLSPHLRFFSRGSLSRLLDEMGFEVASIDRRRGSLLALATR
jgi:SAM-dependent methyltransferase